MPDTFGAIVWKAVPIWLALLVLLIATLVLAYIPMGRFNTVLAIAIAVLKALLVVLFFMHLRRPDPLLRLAGAASVLWLSFLFILTLADVIAR